MKGGLETCQPPPNLPHHKGEEYTKYNGCSMNIDRSMVLHIAKLARIELTDAEIELFQSQLSTIVQYIDQLNEIHESAEPFSLASGNQNRVRPDEPGGSLSVDDALKNAPDRRDNLFRVPRILP